MKLLPAIRPGPVMSFVQAISDRHHLIAAIEKHRSVKNKQALHLARLIFFKLQVHDKKVEPLQKKTPQARVKRRTSHEPNLTHVKFGVWFD